MSWSASLSSDLFRTAKNSSDFFCEPLLRGAISASRSLSVTKTLTDNGFEATIDLVISLTHCDTKAGGTTINVARDATSGPSSL